MRQRIHRTTMVTQNEVGTTSFIAVVAGFSVGTFSSMSLSCVQSAEEWECVYCQVFR